MIKVDKHNEVLNDIETYKTIASQLKKGFNMFIGWTDGADTHFDILFSYRTISEGSHQRGIRGTDLFVSVMSIGSYGFKIDSMKDSGYVAEKLFHGHNDCSVEALTELINGVCKVLYSDIAEVLKILKEEENQ